MMRNPARCRAHNERKGRKPRQGHRQEDYRHRNGPRGRHIGANKLRENRTKEYQRFRIGQVGNHPELIGEPASQVINAAGRDGLF